MTRRLRSKHYRLTDRVDTCRSPRPIQENCIIRVNVTYANKSGARFDHDYYVNKHIKMVRERCGPYGLEAITVDRGLVGVAPGSPATYACVASLTFATLEGLQEALAGHGAEIMGDIPNYTDVERVIQVSEIPV